MSFKPALEVAGRTDPGIVRKNNEDNLAIDEGLGLFVVADGMGGHNAGEVASELAASTILEFARKMIGGDKVFVPEGGDPALSLRGRQLEYFVKSANTAIFEKGRAGLKDHGMGTTVVAVLADAKSMTVAHVGDSRLYIFRKGTLTQITEDHSLVTDQVRQGLISPEEASRSNLQNVLTRALGTEENVLVDISEHPLLPGDVLLLVSDGLNKMVTDDEAARVLREIPSPAAAVDKLIEMSNAGGGVDNVTVVIARVPEPAKGLKGLIDKIFGSID